MIRVWIVVCLMLSFMTADLLAQYSKALADNENAYDAPVPGFVGPQGDGFVPFDPGDENVVNPLFLAWADAVVDYSPAPGVHPTYGFSTRALGPATGDEHAVVSLGDLSLSQIANGDAPGSLTLSFNEPIIDSLGADFVVYENGHLSLTDEGGAGAGGLWAELAYVEVSSDGTNFARFDSRSNMTAPVGPFGLINPSEVYQLAGKHLNSDGESWGTPFDLGQLAEHPMVQSDMLDLDQVRFVRLVDIPGSGDFRDSLDQPIYDGWLTTGSGGADIDAVGAISQLLTYAEWSAMHGLSAEEAVDGDSWPNFMEYAFGFDPMSKEQEGFSVELLTDAVKVSFPRDERALESTIIVEISDDMDEWVTLAEVVTAARATYRPEVLAVAVTSRHAQRSLSVLTQYQLTLARPANAVFIRLWVKGTQSNL